MKHYHRYVTSFFAAPLLLGSCLLPLVSPRGALATPKRSNSASATQVKPTSAPKRIPRVSEMGAKNVEVLAPTWVEANKPFPVMYRTRPNKLLTLSLRAKAQIRGESQSFPVDLLGVTQTSPAAHKQVVLKTPGIHHLTLTFATNEGATFEQTLDIKVLSPQESAATTDVSPWVLPDKAIYFLRTPTAKWNKVPIDQQESIRLERTTFAPLKPEPEYEDEWWRLSAWNEIANTLRVAWLPPRDMIQVFENAARPSLDRVAYAAYTCKGYNLIIMSEIGKQSWVYIEQPKLSLQGRTFLQLRDVLAPSLLQSKKTSSNEVAPSASFMMRPFRRYRSLTPHGAAKPVRILFIHIGQPSQVRLISPTY